MIRWERFPCKSHQNEFLWVFCSSPVPFGGSHTRKMLVEGLWLGSGALEKRTIRKVRQTLSTKNTQSKPGGKRNKGQCLERWQGFFCKNIKIKDSWLAVRGQQNGLISAEPPIPNSVLNLLNMPQLIFDCFKFCMASFCRDNGALMGLWITIFKIKNKQTERLFFFLKASAPEIKFFLQTYKKKKLFPSCMQFFVCFLFLKRQRH